MQSLDALAKAGAIATSHHEIAIGTHDGVVRYRYPDLANAGVTTDLFAEGCDGLQYADAGLLVLGHDVLQSHARPANWAHGLILLDGHHPQRRLSLGPGNWTLVKGRHGTTAILYDASEGQGVCAVDVNDGVRWAMSRKFERIVADGNGALLALGTDTVARIAVERGALLAEHVLPREATWTAVAADGDDLLLGGYSGDRLAWALARWTPGQAPRVMRIPLHDVFTADQLAACSCDEETCGADVFCVASISVQEDGQVCAALGGDGERLGACQGSCALALLDGETLALRSVQIIDVEDGASGMLHAPDGGIVLNCGASVYVLPRGHGDVTSSLDA